MDGYTLNLILYTAMVLFVLLPFIIVIGVLLLPMCTGCETPEARKTYAVMQILLILVLFIAMSGYMMVSSGKEFFIDNFETYRCRPWFMPFVRWVRPDVDPQENMKRCASKKTSMLIGMLAVPLINVTKTLGTGMNQTSKSVNIMAKGAKALANTISSKIEHSNRELGKFQAIALYLFIKTKAIFDKIGALVFSFYYALVSVTDLINLVLMLPEILLSILAFFMLISGIVMAIVMMIGVVITFVGGAFAAAFFTFALAPPQWFLAGTYFAALGVAIAFFGIITATYVILRRMFDAADRVSYCCFAPNTRIVMRDGTTKRIKDVRVGDVLQHGVRVHGTLLARSDASDWCLRGCTVVSADHFMWDAAQHRWLRAGDTCPRVQRLVLRRHCLVTDRHVIPTVDGWFADFQELDSSVELAREAQSTLRDLNCERGTCEREAGDVSNLVLPALERGEIQSGFEPWTKVATCEGIKEIKDVRVGDWLDASNRVLGTYRVELMHTAGGRAADGVWIPCDQIVKGGGTGDEWHKWYNNARSTFLQVYGRGESSACARAVRHRAACHGYHLITSTGNFALRSGMLVRDFVEIRERRV